MRDHWVWALAALTILGCGALACAKEEPAEVEDPATAGTEGTDYGGVGAAASSEYLPGANASSEYLPGATASSEYSPGAAMSTEEGGAERTELPPTAASGGTPGVPASTATLGYWEDKGTGDCTGKDIGSAEGVSRPSDAACTPDRFGTIAVCWDGKTWHNPPASDHVWCTFKGVGADACSAGGNPGAVFECHARPLGG